jgi:peptidyl-tRNA hydrolase
MLIYHNDNQSLKQYACAMCTTGIIQSIATIIQKSRFNRTVIGTTSHLNSVLDHILEEISDFALSSVKQI